MPFLFFFCTFQKRVLLFNIRFDIRPLSTIRHYLIWIWFELKFHYLHTLWISHAVPWPNEFLISLMWIPSYKQWCLSIWRWARLWTCGTLLQLVMDLQRSLQCVFNCFLFGKYSTTVKSGLTYDHDLGSHLVSHIPVSIPLLYATIYASKYSS